MSNLPRVEKLFEGIAKRTWKDVRINKLSLQQAVKKNWQATYAGLVKHAPKDIFNAAKPDVQAKVADIIKQHQLPAEYANIPIIERAINSSMKAYPHRNVPLIYVMDLVKDVVTTGEHKLWSYKKYATKNGLDDDMSAIVGGKNFKKIDENTFESILNNQQLGRFFRLSDTESLSMMHIKMPEPLQKIMQGLRSIIEGVAKLRDSKPMFKVV